MERARGVPERTSPFLRFVAWFLNQIYGPWAGIYDLVASVTSLGQWWTWQTAADTALPDGRLLELGHGTGRNTSRLAGEGFQIVAVDRSRHMSRIAARRAMRAGADVTFVRADAQHLPFPAACFSGALATFPSEKLFHPLAVGEALRVLQSNGVFVMIPMAWIRGGSPGDRLAAWLYRVTGQSIEPDHWDMASAPSGFPPADLEVIEQPRAKVLRVTWTKAPR